MVIKVIMPKFGLTMETGTVDEWMVKIGEKVAKGDVLAEVSSEKITNTVLSPEDGYLRKIIAAEGDTLDCGEVIALMTTSADEEIPEAAGTSDKPEEFDVTTPVVAEAQEDVSPQQTVAELDIRITPRAKKMAEENKLDYRHIQGTGRLGAITVDDLKKHGKPLAEATVPSVAPAKRIPLSPVLAPRLAESDASLIRKLSTFEKTTARTMLDSLAGMAQTTLAMEADVTQLASVYRDLKDKYARNGVKLTYTAFIIKAVAMALEDHPRMRATLIDDDHVQISNRISIGVAVDMPDENLIVPVIRDANLMDLRSIALKLEDLAERARTNGLELDELGNATLTVSNMGTMGVTYFTPVLNPPEGALLGIGAIRDQVVVNQGMMYIAPVMYLSLTHDHRFINGGAAARFLSQVVDSLQHFAWM